MPPQSRGGSLHQNLTTVVSNVPPTLAPFFESLSSPESTISGGRTPTGPLPNGVGERHAPSSPTPRSRSHTITALGQEIVVDDDDVTLDDDDFQSHYSRQSPASSASESSSEESDNVAGNGKTLNGVHNTSPIVPPANGTNPLHLSHSTRSLPPPPPIPLYPPFYGRPPTPLPPSPSLTSLLRPPSLLIRSTTSTRPTTPDSSDVETPNDTEAAVAQSARRATVAPSISPKVPTYEYYGFVLYLASSLAFLLYLLWSFLPSPFLHAIGVTYYPNRWWSLAIPSFIVMTLVYIYVALLAYNAEYLTLPMGSLECLVDERANVAVLDRNGRIKKGGSKGGGSLGKSSGRDIANGAYGLSRGKAANMNWRMMWSEGTDAVMDVPIGGVCEILYGEGRMDM